MYPEGIAQLGVQGVGVMGQSLVQIYIHAVWSTKHRKPSLKRLDLRERLFAYMSGICRNHNSSAIRIGGADDHCHLLFRLGKAIDVSRLIREIKRDTSQWSKRELLINDFYWQPATELSQSVPGMRNS